MLDGRQKVENCCVEHTPVYPAEGKFVSKVIDEFLKGYFVKAGEEVELVAVMVKDSVQIVEQSLRAHRFDF